MKPPPKNGDAPRLRLKNRPESGKNGRLFDLLHGAPRVLRGDVISLCRIVANTQNYTMVLSVWGQLNFMLGLKI